MRFIIFVSFVLISACNFPENKNVSTIDLVLKITPIEIEIDTLGKYSYDVFTFKEQGDIELIVYNNTSHCIEFFNFNKKTLNKRLFLENDGPKAIADVQGIYYHNNDSIFLYTRGTITIINDSYSKEANQNLFTYIEDYDLNYEPIINYHFRLYYLPEIKSIPLFNVYYDDTFQVSEVKGQISLFDITNYKISTLPYYHTEAIESDIEYGFLNYSTISQPYKGQFFVNQVYSPITYKFNSETEKLEKVILADKTYHKANRNIDDWEPHAVESNFYNQLEKLNDENYIRLLWNEVEYEPKENGFLKKQLTLQIYDNSFNLVKEINLEDNTYYPYSWFIANNKIYLQAGHPLYQYISEEELIIHELELVQK